MDDPRPINLATDDELRSFGWTDVSRDQDGHVIGVMNRPGGNKRMFQDWLVEQVDAGLSVYTLQHKEPSRCHG